MVSELIPAFSRREPFGYAAVAIALGYLGMPRRYHSYPVLVWSLAAASFIWLIILFGFTLSDYVTREWSLISQ